jgi:hypothetical protein
MIILEIILQKAIPLPEGLKHLSQTWEKTQTNCHEIYSTTLDYLGDEHIFPLNHAYEKKQIVSWSCIGARREPNEVESVLDYTAAIIMN